MNYNIDIIYKIIDTGSCFRIKCINCPHYSELNECKIDIDEVNLIEETLNILLKMKMELL
jgi:hypothetical protein